MVGKKVGCSVPSWVHNLVDVTVHKKVSTRVVHWVVAKVCSLAEMMAAVTE